MDQIQSVYVNPKLVHLNAEFRGLNFKNFPDVHPDDHGRRGWPSLFPPPARSLVVRDQLRIPNPLSETLVTPPRLHVLNKALVEINLTWSITELLSLYRCLQKAGNLLLIVIDSLTCTLIETAANTVGSSASFHWVYVRLADLIFCNWKSGVCQGFCDSDSVDNRRQ